MTDSLKLAEMQRSNIEFERQRHLANWFIKSSPHMATPATVAAAVTSGTVTGTGTGTAVTAADTASTAAAATSPSGNAGNSSNGMTHLQQQQQHRSHSNSTKHNHNPNVTSAPVFFLISSNGTTSGGGPAHIVNGKHSNNTSPVTGGGVVSPPPPSAAAAAAAALCGTGGGIALGHYAAAVEGRKPKLRRFNSHDTSSNMFSVADFENARLARRNENEMKQRLERRMRMSANGGGYVGNGLAMSAGMGAGMSCGNSAFGSASGCNQGGDYSTGDSKASKYSNDSQHEPLPADVFLDRFALPSVVRISYKTKFSDETLQSSSSNGSSTATTASAATSASGGGGGGATNAIIGTGTSSSTASSNGNVHMHSNTSSSGGGNSAKHGSSHISVAAAAASTATCAPSVPAAIGHSSRDINEIGGVDHGELFLLYRLIRQRHIYHGHNAKTAAQNRKKGVLIPQEFPGYFSLLNDKGLPTATLYTTLIQLVRERVYKFVSVDNMPAFTESQPNAANSQPSEGCLPIYTQSAPPPPPPANVRPQYIKTTARGGQVFRLLAVFEDGKQDHNAIGCAGGVTAKSSASHGREKEKGRYAQLLNENRQVLYVSLSTKGKFYEIEPGVPQILQKLGGMGHDANKKANPDCVHRITALVTPQQQPHLPLTLRYISGPNGCASAIPENVCITHITTENVVIACPIEDVEVQSPLQLRKLHLTKEMNLLKNSLGFESEQRMLANPNVQNILKFCQFNCDQFLKMVEVEILHRPERSGSKSRVEGLKILKPLHLPKLLRREKTTIPAHEKEDSIIFLSKSDLANLEAKEAAAQAAFENAAGNANRITEKMKVFQSTKKKWFRKQDKHATHSLTSYELDVQAKRMSMERYSDMSKLLQERFGDKPNTNTSYNAPENESISEPSGTSDIGCSDTETTTLATIDEKLKRIETNGKLLQKSMSLQDIELISGTNGGTKPELLAADTISEAGTDLEDIENQAPVQQVFITEKLYNEFHVKTRQYSKSSSSLHQLLNFSLPQKMQLHDNKRSLAQIKQTKGGPERRLDFNIGEPVTGRRAAGGLSLLAGGGGGHAACGHSQSTSLLSPLTPTSLIDDLPYSSVRDSLVLSSDESASDNPIGNNVCQALNLIDYTKENIYAEICHDTNGAVAIASAATQSGNHALPTSHTRETFSGETHSTEISDDYGDYASLTYPTTPNCAGAESNSNGSVVATTVTGQAISRVQINCSSSPVSYHTVYLGDEPLSEHHYDERMKRLRRGNAGALRSSEAVTGKDRSHITTVALEGNVMLNGVAAASGNVNINNTNNTDLVVVDNIYSTLK